MKSVIINQNVEYKIVAIRGRRESYIVFKLMNSRSARTKEKKEEKKVTLVGARSTMCFSLQGGIQCWILRM